MHRHAGPWSHEETSPPVATPSWLAPRRSVPPLPISLPVSQPPPRIIELVEGGHPSFEPLLRSGSEAHSDEHARLTELVAALEHENTMLRNQLAEATLAMASLRREVLAASEPELVGLACAIGEKIANCELRTEPRILGSWVQQALSALASKDDAVLAVGTELALQLEEASWRAAVPADVKVEADPSLAPWGCEIRRGGTLVRLDAKSRIAAIVEALGLEGP